jgi:tetratricopeptide (TPR) repeat protein/predicted Ser/Thr protein kinase
VDSDATLRSPERGEPLDAALMRARMLARLFDEHEPLPRIDRFELLEELGRGGMGRVYLAYDPKLERKIALKRLLDDASEPARGAALLREAQGLARLAHPNVVAVFEVGQGPAGVWIAMEYVAGQSLSRWLEGEHDWREILSKLIAAGRGLAAAHAVGLLHRDVKPSNVMIGDDGRARVLDFGLAAQLDRLGERRGEASTLAHDEGTLASRLALAGTPAYMAPEAFDERGQLGPHTDQWAFCVTCYEALSGRRPFRGDTLEQLVADICERPVAPPPVSSRVPAALARALVRGLAKSPHDRWPSLDALLDVLEAELAPPRRRWPLLGLGVACVGLALGWWFAARELEPCPADPDALVGIWDTERRDALRARFEASPLPHADAAAQVLVDALDRWSATWVETRRAVCVETRVSGTASDELLDERSDCLARRRQALAGMLDELHTAPLERLVSRSPELLAALPEPSECAGHPSQRLPTQPVHALALLAGYRELERATTRGRLGEGVEAGAAIDRLLAAPGLVDQRPFVLEARLRRAELAFEAGSSQRGLDAAHEVALAAAAEGLDALALAAGLSLAQMLAEQGRVEIGAWVLGELEQHPHAAEPRVAARLAWTHARLDQQRGELDRAIAGFERTLELDPRVATQMVLLDIGHAHAERGELEPASRAYERAAAAVTASWGPASPSAARIELARGQLAVQRGELDAARTHLVAGERILAGAEPGPSALRASFANALAKLAMNEGDLAGAEQHVEAALGELEALGELDGPEAATNFEALGVIRFFAGDFAGAIAAYERALDIAQRLYGNAHWRVGLTRSNLAEAWFAQGRDDMARREFEAAIAILERALAPDDARLALPLKGLGLVALAEHRFEQACDRLEAALRLVDGTTDPQELADVRFALARALAGAGREAARAKELAEQAEAGFAALGLLERRDAVARWLAAASPPTPRVIR